MYYVVSVLALSTLLAVTGLLAVKFWVSRPVNLQPDTDRLAEVLATELANNFVPAQNVSREPARVETLQREGVDTSWTAHNFKVTLPPHIKGDVLKDALRKAMSEHFVKLVDEEKKDASEVERFALYYDNLAFATVSVIPEGAASAPAYRSDLRSSSRQLANLVESELASFGPELAHTRAEAIEQEDLNALWSYTYFTAQLPPGMTLGELKQRLEPKMSLPDVSLSTEVQRDPPVSLLVSIAGKACVGIACTLAPSPAKSEATGAITLNDVLEDGILGSEPDESMDAPLEGKGMIVSPAPAAPEPVAPAEAPRTTKPAPEKAHAPAKKPAPQARIVPPGGTARLAILIDDGGNNSAHGARILALDNRLTLAILPNTPFAVEIAEKGAAKGFEIMLHMPMETDSGSVRSVPGTVFTKMGKDEIQKLTNAAIDQIPHVVGINNHTGSKFTTDREKMDYVLEVLKTRGLYFIDSVTIHNTIAYEAAREMGVPSARRDVFLDDSTDIASIRRQYAILLDTAIKHGQAVGIGHFQSPSTAKVLAEEIPKLAEAGIELVHASELVQ